MSSIPSINKVTSLKYLVNSVIYCNGANTGNIREDMIINNTVLVPHAVEIRTIFTVLYGMFLPVQTIFVILWKFWHFLQDFHILYLNFQSLLSLLQDAREVRLFLESS